MHILKHYALSNVFVIKNLVCTNVQVYVTFVNNIVFNHSKMIIELKDFASFFEQFWEKKKKKICFVFLYFFFIKKILQIGFFIWMQFSLMAFEVSF